MSVVNTETGELIEPLFRDWFQKIEDAFYMSDAELFAGLDRRTVAYLRARLVDQPEIRPTLCQAARLRAADQRAKRSPSRARYVYFIEAEVSGLIKIGSASNPQGRLAALQTGSPEPLVLLAHADGGERVERELHARFAAYRSHGEWFRPSDELAALIAEVAL